MDLEVLERHFHSVEKIILSRQDPITGLLPASTAITAHGDYTDAWVRDNVYSILSVWGLGLSYKRYDPNHHRGYLLNQSVVKLMRGLLAAMMRQSNRLEAFKTSLNPIDALHAKYGTHTGLAVVGDDEWGHLQLDATSLYLLMLAQMIQSGLQIIYTIDEVNFIQNLVHYISRTYCTPDYGIWERGNKINHGSTEINCSSVGMAKAALEAMDGFNLFGALGSQPSIVHVVSSDIARSRLTLESLLPRESNSKETDAALLSIIGYPAYAVEEPRIYKLTRDKILKKLVGRYGCKRFLLDGHQSALEDSTRLHYEPSELREFEHIESEWPLFFTYLLLDALMKDDKEQISHWYAALEPLFVEHDGEFLLPELYYVPQESIDAEKSYPGSQNRLPNENIPLVWAQSLFILSELMLDGLLHPGDIDPLNRRGRLDYQQRTIPLVPILAENVSVKQKLSELGIVSETIDELKPLHIMNASILSEIHTKIGKNTKLSLSGRPLSVIRTISTASIHLIMGEKIFFLPYYFNPQGFYFSYDNTLLVEHFRSSLKFLVKHWNRSKPPILPFLVREDMLNETESSLVLTLLHEIQNGICSAGEIRSGTIMEFLDHAAIEKIDYLEGITIDELESNHWQRHSYDPLCYESDATHELYNAASSSHSWSVIRRMSDLVGNFDDRLEDALLDIVIRQKRLAVGRAYSERATFSKPHDCMSIISTISEFCGDNVAERILTQEIVLHIGHLIRNEPELFANMITLRTWYFVQLLVGQISREFSLPIGDGYLRLLELAPHAIYNRLRRILTSFTLEVTRLIDQENLHALGACHLGSIDLSVLEPHQSQIDDWHLWREQMGMVGNLPTTFYKNVWHLLRRCNGLVVGDKYNVESRIGSEYTLESTAGEQNFALRIDTRLQAIHAPDYRQLNIEAIESLSRLFRQSPDLNLKSDLVLDVLIGHAVRIAWEKDHSLEYYDEERAQAWESFYRLSICECDQAFHEAFIYLLTPQESKYE